MNRRSFVQMGLTSALAAQTPSREAAAKRSRPNILFLMADQLRSDCLGCYGNRVIQTPNLDRLASEGVRFTSAYTSVPSCTPARSALLTGLSPWHHGMLGMTAMASRYPLEKPRALAEAGYYTTAIGKNHFNPIRNSHGYHQMLLDEHCTYWFDKAEHDVQHPASPEERCDYEAWFWSQFPTGNPHATGLGWNDYRGRSFVLPERLHPTTWTGDTAVNFLRTYERPEPFFLKVSFIRPHSPYDPPAGWMKKYEGANIPPAVAGDWAQRYIPRSGPDNDIWHGAVPPGEIRQSRQAYYGSVSHVDDQIGRVLEVLEQRKLLDETLIVFLADHGDMLGDQHLWRKTYGYEPSARIPMLMRWPTGMLSSTRGITRREPVELRDILPTLLEAAGTIANRTLDGRSLLSLIREDGKGWREWIDLEHNICYSPANHWSGLTDGNWKYIFHARDGEQQLFHLEEDPHELRDLASDARYETVLRQWRSRLIDHLAERGDEFVKGGTLALRPQGRMTSPNFPGGAEKKA
ncbi:MAG: arylsulfatase [Acidobacteriota bacterium]|nr:arylsulfatase [Acidobacteriota bacterium]